LAALAPSVGGRPGARLAARLVAACPERLERQIHGGSGFGLLRKRILLAE